MAKWNERRRLKYTEKLDFYLKEIFCLSIFLFEINYFYNVLQLKQEQNFCENPRTI